jgi:hypothetical protein
MAPRIVRRSACSAGTLYAHGRPRSRILHPIWKWDGLRLTGWSLRVSPGTFPLSQAGEKLAWREQESKNG